MERQRAMASGDRKHAWSRKAGAGTIEGLKSTVHCAMEGFKQLQETVDGGKTAVDAMLESVKGTVDAMVQHVKPTADLLDYGRQNPWLLMGCAILMGYILGSVARENTFAR
jgi:hypothetical protein